MKAIASKRLGFAALMVLVLALALPAEGNASSATVTVTATVGPVLMVTADGDGSVSVVTNSDRLSIADSTGERPVPRGRSTMSVSGDWCVCSK